MTGRSLEPTSHGDERRGRPRIEEGRSKAAYFLGGRQLESGSALEILLAEDRWLAGRFEWTGTEVRWPSLRIDLGGSRPRTTALPIPPDAVLRWRM